MRWNATVLEGMSQDRINQELIDAYSDPDVAMKNFVGKVQVSPNRKSIYGYLIRIFFYGVNPIQSATKILDAVRGTVGSKPLERALLWEQEFLRYACSGAPCARPTFEKTARGTETATTCWPSRSARWPTRSTATLAPLCRTWCAR